MVIYPTDKIRDGLILIAGPTASGKSDLAMKLAAQSDCVIINADSMQVYDGLRLITARPSLTDEENVPHRLFGHVSPHESYSVARWLEAAADQINRNLNKKNRVIVVGGTGLYFSALTKGLSSIPEIDPVIREKWRGEVENPDANLHHRLARIDRDAAAGLKPNDLQRISRALEVIESTGKSILEWQNLPNSPPIDEISGAQKIVLLPDRARLRERINRRFDRMIEYGAVNEVRAFLQLEIEPAKTAMKAIGVPQLASYLAGNIDLETASEQAKAASRQYAKRQYTWFRNQFADDWVVMANPD